jgi:hypothetical protein
MKSFTFYFIVIAILLFCVLFGQKWKSMMYDGESKCEYEMVKQYLLNDSPLYGYNRPKIWIHSKYEINARKWKNFQSRNSTDLNQPYLYLTIQSIINHCSNDFHICLIDDDTFSKLMPTWDIDLKLVAEPLKSQFRDIAMLNLLYYYGGIVVPNSFLCIKNLIELYSQNKNSFFVAENINRCLDTTKNSSFIPDTEFMGCIKNNECVLELMNSLKKKWNGHFSQEMEFQGYKNNFLKTQINLQNINLIPGEYIGIKKRSGKPILIDDLMEEEFLDVDMDSLYGIYIPKDELLKRTKYQWFSILPTDAILECNIILTKFFKISIVDYASKNNSTIQSLIAL